MNEIPLWLMFSLLFFLLATSAFFSGSETGMMSLNPYKLKHLKSHSRSANRANRLLKRTDRLIGVILIGNNLANNLAAVVTTLIAIRLFGSGSETLAAILLTLVMLIFAEITPKTIAALHPERFAFPASFVLQPLLKLLSPVVLTVNWLSNGLVRLFGFNPEKARDHGLSADELRAAVDESGSKIDVEGQGMLLNVLELENVTVNDVMVPRNEVVGLNLEDDMEALVKVMVNSEYTRLPVYNGDINNIVGILHMRRVIRLLRRGTESLTKEAIKRFSREPYFIPENTPLHRQLLNFRQLKRRIGLVVDEYGEILGLLTMSDILEEIVGDFTTDLADEVDEIVKDPRGGYIINGGATIREINRATDWDLPTDGPKTLNGLALEYLEDFPDADVGFTFRNYRFETSEINDKMIRHMRVWRMHSTGENPTY